MAYNVAMPVSLSRRMFLAASATSGIVRSAPLKSIGLQLYTLRNILPQAPDAVLEKVAAMGYKEVEAIRGDLQKVAPAAKRLGLAIPSCHFEAGVITGRWGNGKPVTIEQVVDEYKAAGIHFVLMPWVDQADRGGADVFRALADKMNKAADFVKKAGMQFCYHHHAFEFAPVEGSKTGMDIFLERMDPKLVQLEVDMFWLKIAGQDPVAFLARHKGRVPLLHVKDVAAGAPVQFSEKLPPSTFKEVGSGTMNVRDVLKAAKAAGVQHFIVEQDQCPGDPLASVKKSIDFLKAIDL
jgi:sugar phosphate isomerase/epimerase